MEDTRIRIVWVLKLHEDTAELLPSQPCSCPPQDPDAKYFRVEGKDRSALLMSKLDNGDYLVWFTTSKDGQERIDEIVINADCLRQKTYARKHHSQIRPVHQKLVRKVDRFLDYTLSQLLLKEWEHWYRRNPDCGQCRFRSSG